MWNVYQIVFENDSMFIFAAAAIDDALNTELFE